MKQSEWDLSKTFTFYKDKLDIWLILPLEAQK